MADAEQTLMNGVTNLSVNGNEKGKDSAEDFAKSWGFGLSELYKLAIRFFKGKSNIPQIVVVWFSSSFTIIFMIHQLVIMIYSAII